MPLRSAPLSLSPRNSRTMPTCSSPSPPPRNPTNPQSAIHLPTERRETLCKRRGTLFNKASALRTHTGARTAVIVLSSKGKLYSFDNLSVKEKAMIISPYFHRNVGAMGPEEAVDMVKKEGKCFSKRFKTIYDKASALHTITHARVAVIVYSKTGSLYALGFPKVDDVISDCLKKQRESRVTKKELDSLNLWVAVLHYVDEKLKDISGSGNSGVGAGCDSEVLNDDDIDSVLQRFEASHPELFANFKDYDRDGLRTSPVNSAVASGSSGKEPMRSVLVGCEFNPRSSLNLSENNPSVNAGAGGHSGVGVGHDYDDLYEEEWLHSLPEIFEDTCPSLLADFGNCNRNGDSNSFLTSPVNSAVAGGGLGGGSTSTLSNWEFVDSSFDFCSGLDENDCLIPPGNSTVHG